MHRDDDPNNNNETNNKIHESRIILMKSYVIIKKYNMNDPLFYLHYHTYETHK